MILLTLLSPKHLIDSATNTKDTIDTVGTTVRDQSTSQIQPQTPRTPETLLALLSPEHLTETATDIKDTIGTADTMVTKASHRFSYIQTPRTPEVL